MSTSVLSGSTSSTITTAAVKSLDTDSSWKGEQKDMEEEVSYPAEQLMAQDTNDSEDADYDPKDDEAQGVEDREEDVTELESDNAEEVEAEVTEAEAEQDEQSVVDSEEFAKEWFEAIDHVKEIAQYHRESIFSTVQEAYFQETGEEASDDMVQDAFKVFRIEDQDEVEVEAEDEELADVDPVIFQAEFDEALEAVRELAESHQEDLVHSICNTSQELTGQEPNVEQLTEIFDRIKAEFAEEAREDFLETYCASENDQDSESDDDDDEEADSDYSPESDPFDYNKDAEEDQFSTDEDQDEDDEESS